MKEERESRNALPKGYEIEGYRIDRVLGAGGFGVTYLATELIINRRVAIKEYLPSGIAIRGKDDLSVHPLTSADQDDYNWGLDRFKKEAETLVAFHHPNIVTVFRFFTGNGTAYLVMAYEDGESLAQILERAGTLSEPELREILDPLLKGLDHVHRAGFLHRDIKPGNIYVRRDGTPVLLDFGAARLALGGRSQSLTSIVSAGYAPFEQYMTKGQQGPYSDIYALGGVLYRATTGQRPPDAPDRIRNDPYVPAGEAAKGGKYEYTPHFVAAIDAALAVDSEMRPQSVAEWRPLFDGKVFEPKPMPSADSKATLQVGAAPPRPQTSWPRAAAPSGPGATRPPATPGASERATAPPPAGMTQPPADVRVLQAPTKPPGAKGGGKGVTYAVAIAGSLLVLGGGGYGGWYFLVEKPRQELEAKTAEAKNAIGRARTAIAQRRWDDARREIDEAKRLVPSLPEAAAAEEELKQARAKVEDEEKLRLAREQALKLIAEARAAMRRRDCATARRLLGEAEKLSPQVAAELSQARAELEECERPPPPPPPPPPPGAVWPTNPELRRAVEETIRRVDPNFR